MAFFINIAISLTLLFGLISCSNFLDKVSKSKALPVKEGYLYYYGDKNVLIYKSTVRLKADSEVFMPPSFKVDLPIGMKFYEINEPADFVIYYSKQQVFYIHIDRDSNNNIDTAYTPDENELDDFILGKLTMRKYKYDIKRIKPSKARRNIVLKKGHASILLYNITPNQFENFLRSAKSFSFL